MKKIARAFQNVQVGDFLTIFTHITSDASTDANITAGAHKSCYAT
ncbi:MAG: hypothetical protein NDP09_05945 [Crenarchaeota archaeon]|nr:hypothetical protein [Thermoproteota archaeon]MCR8501588.1 hypothetical protein [Thermoproteota archaeon]